jgi:hypothetical protein
MQPKKAGVFLRKKHSAIMPIINRRVNRIPIARSAFSLARDEKHTMSYVKIREEEKRSP